MFSLNKKINYNGSFIVLGQQHFQCACIHVNIPELGIIFERRKEAVSCSIEEL